MSAPDEHYAVVGNQWVELERAVKSSGGTGEDMAERISSLKDKLPASTIKHLHYLRTERNALVHEGSPLSSPDVWKARCSEVLDQLAPARSAAGSGGFPWWGWIIVLLFMSELAKTGGLAPIIQELGLAGLLVLGGVGWLFLKK